MSTTQNEYIFALFIGRSASGKSAAAASFPGRFLEIDFDLRANGILNAINQGWLRQDQIDIQKFDPFAGLTKVIDYLNSMYLGVHANNFIYKSIDIGGLGSLIRLFDATAMMTPRSESSNKVRGLSAITEPFDYKFESQMCHRVFDFLRTFPCNVTVAAHIIEKYGKRPGSAQYAPSEAIGEKLNITSNLSESVLAIFNDVYKFTKEVASGSEHFYVEFSTEIARNSYGLPPGKFEITKKPFYPFLMDLIQQARAGETIKPTITQSSQIFNFS